MYRLRQSNSTATLRFRTVERLDGLLRGAGFADVQVRSEIRSFSFASYDDYFQGTESGAGISGQAYVKLPRELQQAVREEVRASFPDGANTKPFTVEMEVLVGSGQK